MFSKSFLLLTLLWVPSTLADMYPMLPEEDRDLECFYAKQCEQKSETMLFSNIVNQQDLRGNNEPVKDMLPCRSNFVMANPTTGVRGDKMYIKMRFNNPHDGHCEVNLWVNNQTQVVKTPFDCGGGFRREQNLQVTIPPNAPPCNPGDGCFLQIYFYSVEPRDYATCIDVVLTGTPTGPPDLKPAKLFQDGYDHAVVDDDYNQYRGQQTPSKKTSDRFELRKCLGNGRVSKQLGVYTNALKDEQKALDNEIREEIKKLEKTVGDQLRAGDKALEEAAKAEKEQQKQLFNQGGFPNAYYPLNKYAVNGDAYGVYDLNDDNAERQLQNTYIPLDYTDILTKFQSKLTAICNKLKAHGVDFGFSDGVVAKTVLTKEVAEAIKAKQKADGFRN